MTLRGVNAGDGGEQRSRLIMTDEPASTWGDRGRHTQVVAIGTEIDAEELSELVGSCTGQR